MYSKDEFLSTLCCYHQDHEAHCSIHLLYQGTHYWYRAGLEAPEIQDDQRTGGPCNHALAGQLKTGHAVITKVTPKPVWSSDVSRTRSEISVEPQSWLRGTLLCEMSAKLSKTYQTYQNINQRIATCCVLSGKLSSRAISELHQGGVK